MMTETDDKSVQNKDVPQTIEELDLSDPTGYELMLDDNPDDDTRLQNAQKRLISIDISNQKGVEVHGNYIVLPGRISLMLMTLTLMLFSVVALSGGFWYFSSVATNYLFPFAVLQLMMFLQIGLYHSSYRAQRTAMCVLITLTTIGIMSYIDWAFMDLIIYPKKAETPKLMLWVCMIGFTCIPVMMFMHLIFLGRGTRTVGVRRVKRQDRISTKLMESADVVRRDAPEAEIPTVITEGVDVQRKTR